MPLRLRAGFAGALLALVAAASGSAPRTTAGPDVFVTGSDAAAAGPGATGAGPQSPGAGPPAAIPVDLADASAALPALVAWLEACERVLPAQAHGLARVARACPGIDYVLAHGPLAGSLARNWPRTLDADAIAAVRTVAAGFLAPPPAPLAREPLAAALAGLKREAARPKTLRERLEDLYARLTSAGDRARDDGWLAKLLKRLEISERASAWIRYGLYALVLALFVLLLVHEARAHGWLRRRLRRARAVPAVAADPQHAAAGLPGERLARRFVEELAQAAQAGLVPAPLVVTCRELAALAAGTPVPLLRGLAAAAPVVERARYAPAPPAPAEIDGALAELDAVAAR